MHAHARVLVVVEPRAFAARDRPSGSRAARRDAASVAGVGGEPDHVAGVGRNLRVHEHHGEFGRGGRGSHRDSLGRLRAAACARRPSIRRAAAPAATQRARRLGERGAGGHDVVDERDARAAHGRAARRTRRGRCAARSRPRQRRPAADPRRRARAAPRAAARCASRRGRRSRRAWLKPRSRCRDGRERQRDDAVAGARRVRPARATRAPRRRARRPPIRRARCRPPYLMRWSRRSIGKRVGEAPRSSRRTAAGARGTRRRSRLPPTAARRPGHAAAMRGSERSHAAHSSAPPVRATHSSQRCGSARRAAARSPTRRDHARDRAALQSNDSAFAI